jgi:hypothetical protein
MAKTGADTLITRLANRLRLDSADTTVRADILAQLNISQQDICQDHSLRFLVSQGTLSVVSSAVAVPSTIDDGKAIALGRPTTAGDGEVEYVPADEWYRVRVDTYGSPTETSPTHYTVALISGTNTFIFKPAAITATVPYLAQLIPTALTDAGSSTSALPEGWENTLLLVDAEAELRRIANEPGWEELKARANDRKERLYSSYRTTKEQPMTDREQQERKVAQEKLRPEA